MQQVEKVVKEKITIMLDKRIVRMDKRSERKEEQLKVVTESNAQLGAAVEGIATNMDSLTQPVSNAGPRKQGATSPVQLRLQRRCTQRRVRPASPSAPGATRSL